MFHRFKNLSGFTFFFSPLQWGVSINAAVPLKSSSISRLGCSLTKTIQPLGTPMTMETPKCFHEHH